MENEVKTAITILLQNGMIDAFEAERDPNYLPYIITFYFQARALAGKLFGF